MTKSLYRCIAGDFEDGHLKNALAHVKAVHTDVENPHELIDEVEREKANA